jgi:hypothetical protein
MKKNLIASVMAVMCCYAAVAQTQTIKGRVINSSSQETVGIVTELIKGTYD